MALTSGFYNAIKVGGVYDRKYNADDYRNVFAAFIHDGVRRSGDNDLFVSSNGLVPTVNIGYAVCGGRWVRLDTIYTLPAVVPPVGDFNRLDAVVLRVNENEAVRAASIEYRVGNPASTPVAPEKDTQLGIAELVLAHVLVRPNATSLTITDKRGDETVCGWVTTPVGYDDYFASLDAASVQWRKQSEQNFEDWFSGVRTDLASVTLYKQYVWRTVLENAASSVAFDIPQYDSTGVDIIEVFVNGLRETQGVDYNVQGSSIVFSNGGGGTGIKSAGTEIVVLCYKSIDGRGLGSVSDEISNLQTAVAELGHIPEYNYICNGATDNVKLSEIAQTFLTGASDAKTMTVRVHGTLGATAPYSGDGTSANQFKWFAFGTSENTTRRICFDFGNCSQVLINCTAGTQNILFYGHNVYVKGGKFRVECNRANTSCIAFNSVSGNVLCERVVLLIAGNNGCYAGATGTFRDCSFAVLNSAGLGRCFIPTNESLLRIFGGDFTAYGVSGRGSAVIVLDAAITNGVVVAEGVNFPTINRSGYSQGHAIYDISGSGKCAYIASITTLTVEAASQYVAGTIKANKIHGTW